MGLKQDQALFLVPPPYSVSSRESSASEANVCPFPAPHGLSCLGAASTLTPRLLCHESWDSCLPLLSSAQLHTVGALHPAQWTSFLCGPPHPPTLASGLLHSVEQFPSPPRPWISGLIVCEEDSTLCLEPLPGSWNTPQQLHLPPWSLRQWGWTLLTRGLIPARAQVPRTEHTPGCQFGLHISASPVPVPAPATPQLWYILKRRGSALQGALGLPGWGSPAPGWRGWEGF